MWAAREMISGSGINLVSRAARWRVLCGWRAWAEAPSNFVVDSLTPAVADMSSGFFANPRIGIVMTEDQVRKLLAKACETAGGQKAWALTAGVSGAYVSDVLAGNRSPGKSILAALGLDKAVTYKVNAA